jgi:hypothetical protein
VTQTCTWCGTRIDYDSRGAGDGAWLHEHCSLQVSAVFAHLIGVSDRTPYRSVSASGGSICIPWGTALLTIAEVATRGKHIEAVCGTMLRFTLSDEDVATAPPGWLERVAALEPAP